MRLSKKKLKKLDDNTLQLLMNSNTKFSKKSYRMRFPYLRNIQISTDFTSKTGLEDNNNISTSENSSQKYKNIVSNRSIKGDCFSWRPRGFIYSLMPSHEDNSIYTCDLEAKFVQVIIEEDKYYNDEENGSELSCYGVDDNIFTLHCYISPAHMDMLILAIRDVPLGYIEIDINLIGYKAHVSNKYSGNFIMEDEPTPITINRIQVSSNFLNENINNTLTDKHIRRITKVLWIIGVILFIHLFK